MSQEKIENVTGQDFSGQAEEVRQLFTNMTIDIQKDPLGLDDSKNQTGDVFLLSTKWLNLWKKKSGYQDPDEDQFAVSGNPPLKHSKTIFFHFPANIFLPI